MAECREPGCERKATDGYGGWCQECVDEVGQFAHSILKPRMKVGQLTLIRRVGDYQNRDMHPRWLCQCRCGNERVVLERHLRRGDIQSCGCMKGEWISASRIDDLTGKTFGRWTVLKRAANSRNRDSRWLCRCECGRKAIVYGSNLRRGISQSCGCLRSEQTRVRDLVGQTFDRLTVVSREPSTKNGPRWLVRCECGTELVVDGRNLKTGNTKSCGCLVREQARRMTDIRLGR